MKRKTKRQTYLLTFIATTLITIIFLLSTICVSYCTEPYPEPVYAIKETAPVEEIVHKVVELPYVAAEAPIIEVTNNLLTKEEEPVVEEKMSREDIELIALLTMAEAEGESEEGKRLVIDTVLNRMDSDKFPDTASGVIYQKSQFSSMWNGRVDRCYVTEEICQLVEEELESRTNYDVVFFHAKKYGKYGTPLFSVGNHYFSSI